VTRLQALWFAIATGDWNRIHFNPFTWFLYKSNLGGQTVTGDMLLSLTKKGALKMVKTDETEIVAFGYEQVEFKKPLHVGVPFKYVYTLVKRRKNICHWSIQAVDMSGEKICTALWKSGYMPVEKSPLGKKVFSILPRLPQIVGTACLILIGLCVWNLSKHPPTVSDESITFSHPAAVAF
jgi:acyl dehydratase